MIASLYLPTTSSDDLWLGDSALVPQVIGVVDKEFGNRLRVAVNGGIRLRTGDHDFVDAPSTINPTRPSTGGQIDAGMSVPFGAALGFSIIPERLEVIGEVIGDVPLEGDNYFPLEALGGAKLYLSTNSHLTLGGGAGLNGEGGSPDFRAFLGIIFEPSTGGR